MMGSKLQITCKQATEYIIKKEEGKLSPGKRIKLWLHIGVCGFCKFFAQQSKFIGKNATHLHNHVDESLSIEDKEKMIAVLKK